MLFFNVMLLTKYLAVFWLKNPFGFQDDFWSLFINIWIPTFSHLLQFVVDFKINNFGKLYKICSGKSFENELIVTNRGLGMGYTASISIGVFLFYQIKVQVKKNCSQIQLQELFLKFLFAIQQASKYCRDTRPLYHSFMYALVSIFFPVSFHCL